MAMKVASTGAAVGSRGLRGLFSTFSSSSTFPFATPSSKADKPPAAEPSTNLFVSGTCKPRWVMWNKYSSMQEDTERRKRRIAPMLYAAKVVTDRGTNYSKGFGFVRYTTIEEAAAGIKGMDGSVSSDNPNTSTLSHRTYYLDGWVIFAEYARPREPPPPLQNYGSQYGHP
ncbi:hypothetical protein RJ639_028176 [Escallonia herrerae]|uniref:RRM domain-containing protein n=1 Tax=Escallonia herrerae TaxID=1293975 RepID=A0AA89BQH4_9ASTE|nr:hypothetical protein RJ639_028176 [Escallonia herrerae]